MKQFIRLVVGVVCAVSVNIHAGAAEATLGADAAKTMPIADAHFHAMPWMEVSQLIATMDRHGIRWAGGAAALGGPARNTEVGTALGDRFIMATGQIEWLSLKMDGDAAALEKADTPAFNQRLARIEEALRDRGARVIGEIHVNTSLTAANPRVQHKVRADADTLKALLNLAAKYKRPLNMHAQWDNDTAREFQRLAESNRSAWLILSHCGSTASASDMRELLQKHPNVGCDLSFRSPPQVAARVAGRVAFDTGLRSDWKKLIEDFPDRFVVGVDDVHNWPDYEATVNHIRFGLLANLRPDVAEKVAYKNAVAWFGLEGAK